MSYDGLFTTASSCEPFFEAVGVVEGSATVVVFFGLSSLMTHKYRGSQ
jgi:hypothetical protein